MNGPSVEHRMCINADLPKLLTELKELSTRIRPPSELQRDRSKDIGQPCVVIRGK